MAGATTYTQNNVLNALLRGVAFPLPAKTFLSLHTADPGLTGANEVQVAAWPAYIRKAAEGDAGAIGDGWTASVAGVSQNTKQTSWPAQNGTQAITITHFCIWDAVNGGNPLTHQALYQPKILNPGDVFLFDVDSLTATMT